MQLARYSRRGRPWRFLVFGVLLFLCCTASAQEWNWSSELVDVSGTFSALAVDPYGNVHIGYLSPDGGGTKYGFRSADTGRWFTMFVDKNNGPVNLALDSHQQPHLCYLSFQTLKYAFWDRNKGWQVQEIGPNSGERDYLCGIAVGPDGAPHVTWYQLTYFADAYYVHIRHAVLKDGAWRARTLDYGYETGKWNSVQVDAKGDVHVSYSAYKDGALRYARSNPDGSSWKVLTIEDDKSGHNVGATPGMGNSMVLNKNGNANFSYRDESTLRYAWPEGDHWRIDIVDTSANPFANQSWINQRTSLALDANGYPHIAYETDGVLKHAWWDGSRWHIQAMGIAGGDHRYASIAISKDNTIYIAYSAPEDRSLRVLVGKPAQPKPVATKSVIKPGK